MTLDEIRANLPRRKKPLFNELVRWIELDNFVRLPEALNAKEVTNWKMINAIHSAKWKMTPDARADEANRTEKDD